MAIQAVLPILAAMGGSASNVPPPPPVSHHWGSIFVSPMGEPFHAEHGDALAAWFAQADTNHDGYLTLDEMQGDADRFFGKLDTNHDGEIDPDELDHYETVIAPETRDGSYESEAPREGQTHEGAARFGLLDLPEPVASADEDLDRGVSLEEFRHAAKERFTALDLDHHGRISLAEFEMIRPPPGPTPHKVEGSGDIDTESVP